MQNLIKMPSVVKKEKEKGKKKHDIQTYKIDFISIGDEAKLQTHATRSDSTDFDR